MVISRMYNQFGKPPATFIILALCLCVVMQMLGVSATMWNPSETPEALGAGLFECLAIPPAVSPLTCAASASSLEAVQQSLHAVNLSRSLFHPPV